MSQSQLTIGNIVTISKGKKHSIVNEASISSRRLIGIDDLRSDELIRFTDDPKGTEVKPKDVLIAWDGANAGTIGYGKEGLIGSTIARLRFKEKNKFHTAFIGEYLKSKFNYLRQTATGATIPHINRKALERISLPSVDFDDQKRTAHLLGKIEELITQRRQHLQDLDNLLQSVFQNMFGDPVRNEKGWKTKTLPELVLPGKNSLKRGPFGGALKKEIFVDSGYLVYEQNHALNNDYSFQRYFITEEKYNELIDFKVLPNDILISCSGVYLGKLSIVPEEAKPGIINQALLKVSLNPEKMKQVFFVYVFGCAQFKKKYFPSNRGGAIPNLPPMTDMKKIGFISPPIELQSKFSTIVQQVEGIKSLYQQTLSDLEALYSALSQKAFKGELDLSRIRIDEERELGSAEAEYEPDDQEIDSFLQQPRDYPMSTLEGRARILRQCVVKALSSNQLPQPTDALWETAKFEALDYMDEDTRPVALEDYEEMKKWLFGELKQENLKQVFDDETNRVLIAKNKIQG